MCYLPNNNTIQSGWMITLKNLTDTLVIIVNDNGDTASFLQVGQSCAMIWSGTHWITDMRSEFFRGMIIPFAGTVVPWGWNICDGSLGTPDLRGRFIIGVSESHIYGETGGTETHTITASEMPNHSHTMIYAQGTPLLGRQGPSSLVSTGSSSTSGNNSTGTAGGSVAMNIMPPFYSMSYIMKL